MHGRTAMTAVAGILIPGVSNKQQQSPHQQSPQQLTQQSCWKRCSSDEQRKLLHGLCFQKTSCGLAAVVLFSCHLCQLAGKQGTLGGCHVAVPGVRLCPATAADAERYSCQRATRYTADASAGKSLPCQQQLQGAPVVDHVAIAVAYPLTDKWLLWLLC